MSRVVVVEVSECKFIFSGCDESGAVLVSLSHIFTRVVAILISGFMPPHSYSGLCCDTVSIHPLVLITANHRLWKHLKS